MKTLSACILAFENGLDSCHQAEDRPTVARYLSELAPILALVTEQRDISKRIPQFERTLGNSWIIDEKPFSEALKLWRRFVDEYK